jgi:3-hydroxyisobutyrate dehydrogenase-like beta-hydroxyacid dehydrogenase
MFHAQLTGSTDAVVYVSGNKQVYETNRQIFLPIAGQPEYLGENIRAGAVLYNAVWVYYFGGLFGFMESLAFIQRSGVSSSAFLKHAKGIHAVFQWHLEDIVRRVELGEYSSESSSPLDALVDALKCFDQAYTGGGIRSEMIGAIVTLVKRCVDAGGGTRDIAAIVKSIESQCNHQLEG